MSIAWETAKLDSAQNAAESKAASELTREVGIVSERLDQRAESLERRHSELKETQRDAIARLEDSTGEAERRLNAACERNERGLAAFAEEHDR